MSIFSVNKSKVVFDREEHINEMGVNFTYMIHNAPDAVSAKAFLEKNPVDKPNYYILVNTPEGTFCRDIQGMYTQ